MVYMCVCAAATQLCDAIYPNLRRIFEPPSIKWVYLIVWPALRLSGQLRAVDTNSNDCYFRYLLTPEYKTRPAQSLRIPVNGKNEVGF